MIGVLNNPRQVQAEHFFNLHNDGNKEIKISNKEGGVFHALHTPPHQHKKIIL